ncbi:neuronal pentraxin-2-like [Acropora muricata]|uniref:neuronal pentraxin-2-like n=1 Tax=Acropora muricata TaxID=159855 RepID=UPI0034E43B9A
MAKVSKLGRVILQGTEFVMIWASLICLRFGNPAFLQSSLPRQQSRNVSSRIFTRDANRQLAVTKLKSFVLDGQVKCGLRCIGEPQCLSYNLAAHPDSDGLYQCDLLATDKYREKEEDLEASDAFHYYSLWSPCQRAPCQSKEICIPDFQLNTFQCISRAQYSLAFRNHGGTSSYVIIRDLAFSLQAFTLCLWMKTDDSENWGTPFSYSTSSADNELLLYNYKNFDLKVHGEGRETKVSANDGRWHDICVTWENNAGHWQMFKDGDLMVEGQGLKAGHVIPGGGVLVLGQEQDELGGRFDVSQSFRGQMTGVQLWNFVLSSDEIMQLQTLCQNAQGNVLAWSGFINASPTSEVSIVSMSSCPP